MVSTVLNVLPWCMSILVLAAGMIAQAPNGRANTVAQIAPDVRQAPQVRPSRGRDPVLPAPGQRWALRTARQRRLPLRWSLPPLRL